MKFVQSTPLTVEDLFETMHICCGYVEDVHVNFCGQKELEFVFQMKTDVSPFLSTVCVAIN